MTILRPIFFPPTFREHKFAFLPRTARVIAPSVDDSLQLSCLTIPCYKILPALSCGYETLSFFIAGPGQKGLRAKWGKIMIS